jgi:hypothetical protein
VEEIDLRETRDAVPKIPKPERPTYGRNNVINCPDLYWPWRALLKGVWVRISPSLLLSGVA